MQKRILLIYPEMGLSGAYVRHLPLSLLYAAVDSLKAGFAIDIVDARLYPDSWPEEIRKNITPETIIAGISVITGTAVSSALKISRWLKQNYPSLSTVWGGPHANFDSENILTENSVDYVISGYGSRPLAQLANSIAAASPRISAINGLTFRNPADGTPVSLSPEPLFEYHNFRDIPYHLLDQFMGQYGQLDRTDRVFPLYSSLGCPYNCTFCSSPRIYRDIPKKYELIPPAEVVDHIAFLVARYRADYIYFIDDDSFVDLSHVAAIIDEIELRGIKVKLGFRGARIDEIMRMDDSYLKKLARAGTDILHIGAESGSQRMLDVMGKMLTVQEIIEVNRKLAQHPQIKAAYNWIIGLPGETPEDLAATRKLVLQLVRDNPAAIIFPPNKFRPLPGTELYSAAVKYGYSPPKRQEEWGNVEVEGDFTPPWYTPQFAATVNMMQVAAYFIDRKFFTLSTGSRTKDLLLRIASFLYRPLAVFRYRYGITALLLEHWLYIRYSRSFRE